MGNKCIISNMVKKFLFAISVFSLLLISCGTTDQETEIAMPEEPVIEAPVEQEEETIIVEPEPEVIPVQEEEPVEVEEVEEIYEDDEVFDVIDDEFTRSTNEMEENITVEEFNNDKLAILHKIQELDDIMSNFEYDNWRKCIAPESLEYYSNPLNLRKAQKKLPDKSIQLKGPRDYFKYVFIPSRKQSQVDEIRYISKNYIKAVEVRDEDDTTVVYYYFVKQNGNWLVHLPEMD